MLAGACTQCMTTAVLVPGPYNLKQCQPCTGQTSSQPVGTQPCIDSHRLAEACWSQTSQGLVLVQGLCACGPC